MTDQSKLVPDREYFRVWDLPLRLFHWLLVIAIAIALLSAEEGSPLSRWHILSGWVAGILVVFRIAWGFVGGEHARFANFVKLSAVPSHLRDLFRGRAEPSVGHNPLGALSVLLLLLFVAATVATGATLGRGMDGEIHELLGWTLLALVALHVAAVILMSILTGENLVRAMIGGTKRTGRHPVARDARRPGVFALVTGLIVIAATAYAIQVFDPEAFTLRSTESFEHPNAAKGGSLDRDDREAGQDAGD